MFKKLQKRSEGFTIIEVMIVLAIAALILLIVLLAVPALQRNSRNTTAKNDASSIAGAINTSESDNNGAGPTGIAGTGSVTVTGGGNPVTTSSIKVNGSTTVSLNTTANAPTIAQVQPGTIVVWKGNTCPAALGGSGLASVRAYSVFYSIETSGNPTLQCIDT